VIVELDGFATHGTRAAFEEDRDRDRRLAGAGYRGMRVTWRHLHEIPTEIAADLGALLDSA
jgi:very-short-patch-repair endonuclease